MTQNRIVGTGMVDPATLSAHPLNWRDHPQQQAEALTSAIDTLGWVKRVIVNQRTGRIVDGHLRVEQALKAGEQVPVVYVDLSEREEALVLSMLDPLAGDAGIDDEKLNQILAEVRDSSLMSEHLDTLLNSIVDVTGLVTPNPEKPGEGTGESGPPAVIHCPRCGAQW